MKNSELPTWLLALLGLSDYTPRGMAKRFAKSPHLAMVQRPAFVSAKASSAPESKAPELAPQAAVTDDTANPPESPATPAASGRRAA